MIDWVTAHVPLRHQYPITGGFLMGINESGEVVWKKEKFRPLQGSFEGSIVVRTIMESWDGQVFTKLWISGNPAKWLQGHNLFGSDDLISLMCVYLAKVTVLLDIVPTRDDFRRWRVGDYKLDRVDVAYMCHVSGGTVSDCLSSLAHQTSVVKRGRASLNNGTCNWGKRTARNVVLKAYDKTQELKAGNKHALPYDILHRSSLLDFSLGKIRLESEFHSRFLDKNGYRYASNWANHTARELWVDQMSKVIVSAQLVLPDKVFSSLPKSLKGTYAIWHDGVNVSDHLSKSTFRRHRLQLLAKGIDISITRVEGYKPRPVSLQRVISLAHVDTPHWAKGTFLLAA